MKRIILLTVVACLSVMGAWAQEMQHNARYPDDPAFTPVADSLKGLICSWSTAYRPTATTIR